MNQHVHSYVLNNGIRIKNRLWLAPLTNTQSPGGRLSPMELAWLESRAGTGFGLMVSAASHVTRNGQGFPGQQGNYEDAQIEGLRQFAAIGRRHGVMTLQQLVHGGVRSPRSLTGEQPVAPSALALNLPGYDVPRALNEDEIEELIKAFAAAARRAATAGLSGIEIHGANGYLITQFLSRVNNTRTDAWGGTNANRARFLLRIVTEIRKAAPPDFVVGLRILAEDTPAQRGFALDDTLELISWLNETGLQYLHVSAGSAQAVSWSYPDDKQTNISRIRQVLKKDIALVAAGGVRTAEDVEAALAEGADFVTIGKAAIITPDWPSAIQKQGFKPRPLPWNPADLKAAGISDPFLAYLQTHGLVQPDEA